MRALLALMFALVLAVSGRGQEREVRVQLEGGEVIAGKVVSMDLTTLRVQVGDSVRTIDAARIRRCEFDPQGAAGPAPASDPAAPSPAVPGDAAPAPSDAGPPDASRAVPGRVRARPIPAVDAPDLADPAQLPHDLRQHSLLRHRIEQLDACYPWLQPAAPMQWISLGFLLLVVASLTTHMSVNVAGAEGASLGRSVGLASWYLVTGLVQLAFVPANDFTVVLMLLANPTLALFWLVGLFGLSRIAAVIAFAVQLGFVALGYGVMELVTAILASIGMAHS